MDGMLADVGALLVNGIIVLLFYKFLWPLISKYISFIDSFLVMLLLGFAIKDKVFHGKLHPVFIILIFGGLFFGCMFLMHTKIGFIVSALFMSYIWTELIVGQISRSWESYDMIWGVFLGVTTFLLSMYFHWKDYTANSAEA